MQNDDDHLRRCALPCDNAVPPNGIWRRLLLLVRLARSLLIVFAGISTRLAAESSALTHAAGIGGRLARTDFVGSLEHHSRIEVRHQPVAAAMGAGSLLEGAAGPRPSVVASCVVDTVALAAEADWCPARSAQPLGAGVRLLACAGCPLPSSWLSSPCGSL